MSGGAEEQLSRFDQVQIKMHHCMYGLTVGLLILQAQGPQRKERSDVVKKLTSCLCGYFKSHWVSLLVIC